MPILNRFADLQSDLTTWRRDLHSHPELMFDVHRTAGFVADKLRSFGVDEVIEGIGRTGVVGLIRGNGASSGKVIGLRADMDALPIHEATGLAYASQTPGKMHACGHDGHTTMLLGAAQYLAENRTFDGTVAVIFQPAEEGGGGGREMVKDGLMDRFGIQQVFGMHNMPGLPIGEFAIRTGPFFASTDQFQVTITGKGAHAAWPQNGIDSTLVSAQIIQSLQSVVSRNVDPMEAAVLTVTSVSTESNAFNVIPNSAKFRGTVRTLKAEVRDLVETRFTDLVTKMADAFGAKADIHYGRHYPVTTNAAAETDLAANVAAEVAGSDKVERDYPALMGGEDFSFMLNERPGAMILVGNGESAGLHHPKYDFNDEVIPVGASFWVKLVEQTLPAQ